MACAKEEHLTDGRSYVHLAEPVLQDLGTHDVEADAPCVVAPNSCRQMHDSENNITGRTVKLAGNSHGVTTITLYRHPGLYPINRGHRDYRGPYGFAQVNSPHLQDWRLRNRVDDLESSAGYVEMCIKERYGKDTTTEDLANKVRSQSTYIPVALAYEHCDALSTRNYTSGELDQDEPGAWVAQEKQPCPANSGKFPSYSRDRIGVNFLLCLPHGNCAPFIFQC
jgi:hypothetical protein